MKKIFSIAVAAICTGFSAHADVTTVKNLYTGEAVNITWENTLTIDPENFAEDVNVGDYISINLENATDVLEIKANGTWLPGSIKSEIANKEEYKAYITADMLATLKEFGMEICGASFTVTGVNVMNDGFQMPEGAIWGGYFWVDNWNTMELFKTAFNGHNDAQYLDVNLEAGYDTYFFKALTKWDDESAVLSNDDNVTKTANTVTLDLTGLNLEQRLADVNALMMQFNPEGGNPFNVTSVVLRGSNSSTGGGGIEFGEVDRNVTVYNMQGMAVRSGVKASEALQNLPSGIYIVEGSKYVVR